jgi:hypothetical protein
MNLLYSLAMVRLDIIPNPQRSIVVLQIVELPNKPLAYVELDPGMLQATLAGLVSAWHHMGLGASEPGQPGSWATMPAIMDPEWRVGVSPLDGALALSFQAVSQNPVPLWLTYTLPFQKAKNFIRVATEKNIGPTNEGIA